MERGADPSSAASERPVPPRIGRPWLVVAACLVVIATGIGWTPLAPPADTVENWGWPLVAGVRMFVGLPVLWLGLASLAVAHRQAASRRDLFALVSVAVVAALPAYLAAGSALQPSSLPGDRARMTCVAVVAGVMALLACVQAIRDRARNRAVAPP